MILRPSRLALAVRLAIVTAMSNSDLGSIKQRPRVLVCGLGGTAAGIPEAAPARHRYRAAGRSIDELVAEIDVLHHVADIVSHQLTNIPSQDQTEAGMLRVARWLNRVATRRGVDGVVFYGGTDTAEELAFVLELLRTTDLPTAVAGQMSKPGRPNPDGPRNLLTAVIAVADEATRGQAVLLAQGEALHSAVYVTKMWTVGSGAFESPGVGPVGRIVAGQVVYGERVRPCQQFRPAISLLRPLPAVAVQPVHAGMTPEMILAVVQGATGIVLQVAGAARPDDQQLRDLRRRIGGQRPIVISTPPPVGGPLEGMAESVGYLSAGRLPAWKAKWLLQFALADRSPESAAAKFARWRAQLDPDYIAPLAPKTARRSAPSRATCAGDVVCVEQGDPSTTAERRLSRLASAVQHAFDEGAAGVVTRGTVDDAFFVEAALAPNRPVVVIPPTAGAAAGRLAFSVAAAQQSAGRGVLLVDGQQIHDAAFALPELRQGVLRIGSPDLGPVGAISVNGQIRYRQPVRPSRVAPSVDFEMPLPPVALLLADIGAPADLICRAVDAGAPGIVLMGLGNGNLSELMLTQVAGVLGAHPDTSLVLGSRVRGGEVTKAEVLIEDLETVGRLAPCKAVRLLQFAIAEAGSGGESATKRFVEWRDLLDPLRVSVA